MGGPLLSERGQTGRIEFLRAYDITAGIAALLIDWAMEGGARRFEDELEDAWACVCHAEAVKTGFITTADLPVNKTVEGGGVARNRSLR